jgi:uncharacterized protein (TIGR03083 family)
MSIDMNDQTASTAPRRGQMDRRTAMRLAADEYTRFADAVASLGADDWTKPTACPAWDVRQLVCHVVGMAEMAAGVREGNRQRRLAGADAARKRIAFIDALTDVQVRERADWDPEQAVRGARDVAPRAARGRRWTPFFVRRRTMPVPQDVNGQQERWSIGYLVDTVLTRDTWMHRVDLADATGRSLHLTSDHDGEIVADVVQEWAERHGRPYSLTLSGPAGGSWARGQDAPTIEMDAIEFCREISGRGPAEGLLETQVPF